MKILNHVKYFYSALTVSILSCCLVVVSNTYAQKSNYPTAAQVSAKMAKLALLAKGGAPPVTLINGAEQDCANAIGICSSTSFTELNSYTGSGSTQEITTGCLLAGETNSVWYTFEATSTGTVGFDIDPVDGNDDYDFAVYNLTALGGCGNVVGATPIRCNWSGASGTTGCTPSNQDESPLSVGGTGPKMMNGWELGGSGLTPPQTYVIIIDNWSASTNGYTITFTGGATLQDPNPGPSTVSVSTSCTANTFTLTMDDYVDCLTATTLGDFNFLQ